MILGNEICGIIFAFLYNNVKFLSLYILPTSFVIFGKTLILLRKFLNNGKLISDLVTTIDPL
jgi:hypothetical protein